VISPGACLRIVYTRGSDGVTPSSNSQPRPETIGRPGTWSGSSGKNSLTYSSPTPVVGKSRRSSPPNTTRIMPGLTLCAAITSARWMRGS
jgi:hypothetical protein